MKAQEHDPFLVQERKRLFKVSRTLAPESQCASRGFLDFPSRVSLLPLVWVLCHLSGLLGISQDVHCLLLPLHWSTSCCKVVRPVCADKLAWDQRVVAQSEGGKYKGSTVGL